MEPVVKVSAGLDVNRKNVIATILLEQDDGSVQEETCEFGTLQKVGVDSKKSETVKKMAPEA